MRSVTCHPPSGRLLIPATPTTYTLELTSRCNSACVGCGNVFDRTLGEMAFEQWRRILIQLRSHMVSLRLTGGEPTLYRHFSALIPFIDGLGVPFVIFSNGLWPETDETLAMLLACHNLDGLLISLHGHTPEAHQAFTGVDSYHRVADTIRLAAEAGLNINTNTILSRHNHQAVPAIVELSGELGARLAAFSRYYGAPTPVTDLTEDEFRTAAATIHGLRDQGLPVQFNNSVPSCFDGRPTKSCPAGITHCTIDPLGRVRPCTHAPHILGDLLAEPVADIWHSEAAGQWRELVPSTCTVCAEFVRCRGGCKAMAYHLRQRRDPLICEPLEKPLRPASPDRIQLYSGARPEPNFTLREESFGYLLINRNQIVPVRNETRPLLDALDGVTTLGQIERDFGSAGLTFVAHLFNKGLVRLNQSPCLPAGTPYRPREG
jgi:radical SAM protein with 4Fe4S-binding SPASM domain